MKLRLSLPGAAALGILALLLLLGAADTARAGTFNPELTVTVEDPEPEANSNFTVDFNVPEGDVNFAAVVSFIPRDWGIRRGEDIPIGAVVGTLTSAATLGLINAACNNVLPVEFTFLNSSLDVTDTVSFLDADDNGTADFVEDKDESGLPDAFEKYPEFITRLLVDENDQPLQPVRRSAGITVVAGINVLLQFLIFEPGTVINEALPSDPELGHPSVTLLQNIGDPEAEPAPNPITDFCTPLTSSNTAFGVTKDNACTDAVPAEALDPICSATGAIIVEEGGTDPDEGGQAVYGNPQDGKSTFTVVAFGQRDADGDGFENGLDTCPLDPNEGNPRIGGDGDADTDGLDAACDPNDNLTNSDEDGDGYLNRGDNCPLVANGENEDNQADADSDQIGDACDPNPDDADAQGELSFAQVETEISIGTGTGPGGPPAGFGDAAGDGGDGGLGTGAIIGIIIGVIAGAIVLGGGAFFALRRGGGGATAA